MGVRLTWAEARKQGAALRALMYEALAQKAPYFGLLVHTDEPELFSQTCNRAKRLDPLLAPIQIRMTGEGVAVCYQPEGTEGSTINDQEIGSPDDAAPYTDI